jgi:DNA repair exonuclease SbcCD ATPase subunit
VNPEEALSELRNRLLGDVKISPALEPWGNEEDPPPANEGKPALAAALDPLEVERLCAENEDLRARVAELEQALEQPQPAGGENWEERQREYESLLDEKSEVIRDLHLKIKELQVQNQEVKNHHSGSAPREEELLALSEELERERQQLKEDEEALMKQMRDMEVQMSRERAEFARQRSELQRLQGEIRHELELAARDAALRDRLAPLQRRHQDLTNRRGAAPQTSAPPASHAPAVPQPPPAAEQPRKDSGLFRRIFRSS